MASTIDQLLAGLQSLITGLANLLPAMTTTNQHLANITQPQVTINNTPSPHKAKTPKDYDGNPNRVTAFIQEINTYFTLTKTTDVETQIFTALSLVNGGKDDVATTWSNSIQSQIYQRKEEIEAANAANTIQPGSTHVPTEYFDSWKQFCNTLLKQFALLNTRQEAIETIRTLEQGNRTCEEYLTVFFTNWTRSGYDTTAGLEEFKRGLNKGLRAKLEYTFPLPEDNPDGTTNINNWTVRACQLDKQFRRGNEILKGKGHNNEQRDNKPRSPPAYAPRNNRTYGNAPTYATGNTYTPAKDPNAMDIDRNRRSGNSGNFKDATCYHCQRKGHIARNCPDGDKPRVTRGTNIRSMIMDMTDEDKEFMKKELGF